MKELETKRHDLAIAKALDIVPREHTPQLISDVATPTFPVWNTADLQELLFESVVGAAGVTDVALAVSPTGRIRAVIAAEVSHTDPATIFSQFGIRWRRTGGVSTSVALHDSVNLVVTGVQALPYNTRLYLPPGGTLYAIMPSLDAAAQITLKMAFLELPLGASFPV